MSVKKTMKGLAMGAVLAGVAALVIKMREEKYQAKAKSMSNEAQKAADRVVKHALSLGKLTKSAYLKLVDTAINEYKGLKELSAEELAEMRSDLRDSWDDVSRMMKDRPCPKPAKPSKKSTKK